MNEMQTAAFDAALPALATFKRAFGRDASPGFVAELQAAREFGLCLHSGPNARGADAVDAAGLRYQIKFRGTGTLNVDISNFEFDFIVLINMDENYALGGIWRMDQKKAREIFAHREEYRKYQVTQRSFKNAADRVR